VSCSSFLFVLFFDVLDLKVPFLVVRTLFKGSTSAGRWFPVLANARFWVGKSNSILLTVLCCGGDWFRVSFLARFALRGSFYFCFASTDSRRWPRGRSRNR
jgi:hypothetical protein